VIGAEEELLIEPVNPPRVSEYAIGYRLSVD
jgi:hypothetical protein